MRRKDDEFRSGDVLRLKCGYGTCVWRHIDGEKPFSDSSNACTRMFDSHDGCIVILKERWELTETIRRGEVWSVVFSLGVGYCALKSTGTLSYNVIQRL